MCLQQLPKSSPSAVFSTLIRSLCAAGRTTEAARALATAGGGASVVTYNAMVTGYCRDGQCLSGSRRPRQAARGSTWSASLSPPPSHAKVVTGVDLYGFRAVGGDWELVARGGESAEEARSKGRTTASATSHSWRDWVTRVGENAEKERIRRNTEQWRPARFFFARELLEANTVLLAPLFPSAGRDTAPAGDRLRSPVAARSRKYARILYLKG
jgi:hypothetical protein